MSSELSKVNKIMSIGSNCIGANFAELWGVRVKGPVDNMVTADFQRAFYLFSGEFYRIIFKGPRVSRNSKPYEMEKYNYFDRIFCFGQDFSIVHNNFDTLRFRRQLKKRIKAFRRYCNKAQKDDSLWFIYSLNGNDEKYTEEDLMKFKSILPEYCSERLICFGIRGHNQNFKKVFKYYQDYTEEKDYLWNNKNCAEEIAKKLEAEFGIKIATVSDK